MSDIFRVVSIDEIYLTKYNAEELKQFFSENNDAVQRWALPTNHRITHIRGI